MLSKKVLWILTISFLLLNIYQLPYSTGYFRYDELDKKDQDLISSIEKYLDQISPQFLGQARELAIKNNVPSWGCGPSSFALAQIINKKFFNNSVSIDATYDNNPYEIIERFGFVKFTSNGQQITGDHSWIELYVHGRIIFIDPTIAQYGKYRKIMYNEFGIYDKDMSKTLYNDYGIINDKISKLVEKINNNIPIGQPPYPGYSIDPQYISYYRHISDLRNLVNISQTPDEWKPWVNVLTTKFN